MKIAVSSSDELIRVDLFLSQRLREFSRTNIQKMIDNKLVKINGKFIKKNSILNYGDIIEINLEENIDRKKLSLEKWKYPLDVIYKDKDFAIINNPRGIISHPAKGNYDKTFTFFRKDNLSRPKKEKILKKLGILKTRTKCPTLEFSLIKKKKRRRMNGFLYGRHAE